MRHLPFGAFPSSQCRAGRRLPQRGDFSVWLCGVSRDALACSRNPHATRGTLESQRAEALKTARLATEWGIGGLWVNSRIRWTNSAAFFFLPLGNGMPLQDQNFPMVKMPRHADGPKNGPRPNRPLPPRRKTRAAVALTLERADAGWRAAGPGEQTIRLFFDQPQRVRRIWLHFVDFRKERTQQFVLGRRTVRSDPGIAAASGAIRHQRFGRSRPWPRNDPIPSREVSRRDGEERGYPLRLMFLPNCP